MRGALHSSLSFLLALGLAGAAVPVAAQRFAPDYALTAPALPLDAEAAGRSPLLLLGPLQLGAAASATGSGLSLQAGQRWFARVGIGVGRGLDSDLVSLGGGYRFAGGDALSMHVTRQLGQERLGLAVRYDFNRAWLRLGYEAPTRGLAGPDLLRFSAGVRF
jgi:hypothetical protein